ncbi:transferrin receptor-like dimerization domain-containing protein [Phenylobacterium sp.]|uniref:transferrin receptor-like dimerization domain-containing protein n=1 Tax=Phenylobacterium sp. TaxID=1871053 RepID=UPI0025E6BFD0|nr:transferrin receptor-like dimerization domain-containing protein [Phenylobacterium sp.]MBX3484021.1 M28 family peptidase [Phenylobacterium sp.]
MESRSRLAALFAATALVALAPAAARSADAALEAKFDGMIDNAEMGGWLKTMAAEPNHVGSAHNKLNAEMTLSQFRSWGWDAKIETFMVLYPTPKTVALELVSGPGAPFRATLTEAPVPGDETSTRIRDELPAYVAFQGDGDVTAPLVYVNYGMPADYDALERLGVSVKGKIVIARYGGGWRGLKPKLAQEHGAVGAIIYSDPRDDGYATDDVYPKGPARPPQGFQRGSVADMTLFPGDPSTPGYGSTKDARRLTREESPAVLKIPVLPIGYGDAEVLLRSLDGPVAPASFRGALPITYHVGGAAGGQVHIKVDSDWSLKPAYNVVATLKGRERPDEWIMRGNHRDGWVFGATDPLAGHVAMMGEAKALGALVKAGWKPRRTIVYTSWDAEEPMLLGSTEWAETHAAELKRKGLVYINSDTNGRGFLGVGGSHSLQHFVNEVAADVKDPQTGVSVRDRLRAGLAVAGVEQAGNPRAAALGKIAADPAKDLPIEALGSGSDYSAFLQNLGLATLNLGFYGEGESGGVYHSAYDTYEHHSRFVDPGHAYAGALAKVTGRLVMRMADAETPVQRYGDFADTVAGYLDEVKKLADAKRDEATARARLLAAGAYKLADDPTLPRGDPAPLAPSPRLDFAPLDGAVAKLKASAAAFDTALAARGASLTPAQRKKLDAALLGQEQRLLRDKGLPFRPWYKNMIYAPGRFTGYGAKTLPGVREAIEERRFDDATAYVALTAEALNDYSAGLDAATAVVNGG